MSSPHARRCPSVVSTILFATALTLAIISNVGATLADTAPRRIETDRTTDGDWAVAGASTHDGYRGMAYVYHRAGRKWVLDATLAPPERGAFARFGGAVAIEGNTLVIGAPWDDGWHGAAYIYERLAGSWRLASRLAPVAAVGDRFGTRVSFADGVVSLATEAGAVARFQRTEAGWTEVARVAAGSVVFAPGRVIEADVQREVEAIDARSAAANPLTTLAIDPPRFVRATDATYEDRTEIRWAAVDTSTFFYKIYRRLATDPPSSNVLIRVASQDDSLYSDVTGTPGVEYTYSVTVVDMTNAEGPAAFDNGRRIIFAPTGFTATDATFENYVQLAWTDLSSVEAGFRILRNGGLLRETAPNTEVIRDSTAVPGTVYSYELIAFDAAANVTAPLIDNGESAFIGAPLQVSASDGQFTDRVRITWLDETELEVNYRVYRSAGGAPTLLATLPPGSISYDDLSAVNGTPYEYCVAAVDNSNRESARTCDAGGIGVLPAPASVLATDGVFDDKVRISWRDVSSTEDGFHIYRMPPGTADSIMVGNVGTGITTFDDDSGVPGTAYTYCVVAFSNEGGRSIPVCDDGLRAVVLAPVSVEATDGTLEGRVDIKWESTATSAVLFKVYRGGAFIRSLGADKRSFSDDGGPAGLRTEYSVRAVTALGAESPATSDSGSRRINAPVSAKASDNEFEDQVAVTWTDRSQIEDGFFVRRRLSGSASPPDRIATRPSNSAAYLDRTGVPGQTYEYFVSAFQAYGPGRADTTESEVGVNAGARALAAATFVEASDGAFETQIGLSWVDNSRYEEAYHLWRRNTATNDSLRLAVLPPNSSRFDDTSIAFGVTYEYSVFAVDSIGGALLGASPTGKDTGRSAILPPAAVSASDSYSDRVVVAWIDQSSLESGYRVSRDGVVLGTTAANATSFSDPTAVRNTPYSYCVEAVFGASTSASVCDPGRSVLVVGDLSSTVNFDSRISAGSQAFANESFGKRIAGDGTRLIVGIPARSGSTYPIGGFGQRAMMFVRVDSQYVVERVFSGNSAANLSLGATLSRGEIGGAVAVHGNSAIVGNTAKRSGPDAPPGYCIDAVNGCAAIYFLERNPSTGAWSWNQTVTDLEGTSSLDMNGDWVVAGGTGARESFVGPGAAPEGTGINASIRIYRRTGSSWTEAQRFNESSPAAYRYFGSSVALSDSTAIVGAPTAVSSSAVPAAYVFKSNPAGVWSQVQSLPQPPFGSFPTSSFGVSVGIDGNWAVVGDPEAPGFAEGRVFVYARGNDGSWSYESTLLPESDGSPTGGSFGTSVSVMGDSILVGAPNARSGEGVAYLFARQDGAWVRRKVLSSTGNAATNVGLGTSVEIAPGTLAAGANRTTVPNVAFDAGAVEVRVDKTVRGPATVTASDATYKDKVQVNWSDNFTTETAFRVYRDGALISTVDPNVRNYVDFDAEPGRTYEYCVTAVLPDGASTTVSCDFGRRPPDGNITGRIGTVAAAGVSDVQVTLDPAPNRALLLDGSGGVMSVTDGDLFGVAFTVEFWYRGHASGTGAYLLRHATQASGDAFSVLDPANIMVRVNGVSQATGVSVNDGEWHHVAIDRTAATGALHLYKDGQPAFTGTLAAGVTPGTTGPLLAGEGLSGALDDLRVWGRVRTADEVLSARSAPLTGAEAGLSAYWPLDAYEGAGAEEVVGNRYGRLAVGAHWVGSAAPLEVFAVSDNQGNYVLPKLRYGTSTTFKVIPTVAGHQFTPAFKTITLSTGNPVQNEVGFTDITSYTVSGFVRHQGLSCVAANVPIFVDDQLRGTTDGNGRYAVPVPPGAHRIEPRLSGHTFVPAAITLENVVSDLADQSFIESTERRLSGLVSGGCNIPIGTLTIKIDSDDGCFSRTIDAAAGFDEVLPPLKFFVRATSVAAAPGGVDPAEVLEFFDNLGAREVDLTAGDQTIDFKYRAPLRVMIEGLPPVTPGCAITVPVIAQMDRYKLTIRVVEDYGTSTCPVDTGTVTVFDEIIDQEKSPVTLVVKNGLAYVSTPNGLRQYETAGNKPNIFAGRVDSEGNDRSYQKSFSVVAEVEGQQSVTRTEWVIVTGSRPRAATFTALSEEIPLYILRDPPGDLSFSSLAKDTSICTKISNTVIVKNSLGFEQKTKVGVDFLLGFIVLTKVRGQLWITTGLEIELEANRNDEFEICAKTTEEFKTSADKLYVGRDGDLYIGVALNLLFAKTDIISIDGCNVVKSEAVTMGVDDVQTIYTFTDFHIRNVVIPQLEDLARLSPSDTLRLNSARRNWESHLALNDSLKAAAAPGENRSFSAGAEYSFSSTVEETRSVDLVMTLSSTAQFSLGFGFDVSATGAEGAYTTRMGLSYARGSSKSTSTSRTTGYTLSDDDIGDFFSVNVKKDLMYGTPVFDLLGGTSSCPWEPWPDPITGAPRTQPLDAPELNVQPPVRNNVPPDSPAVFTLNLTNDSIDLREYQLFAVQESNPGGAVLRLDGDPFSTNGVPFFIDPGQTRQATLTVERGPTQYFYKNLKIVMVPPCEYELFRSGGPLNLSNSVLVSVGFQAPCSDITLLRPNPGWSVRSGTDSLELILKDFELAISEVDSLISVGAEYQRSGTDVWTPIGNEIPLSQMSLGVGGKPASINIKWPVTNVPEGTYAVRAFTRCPNGRNYSGPATGVIDRTAPVAFGLPQPADGTLSFGEEISITFNEDIDCATANPVNVRLDVIGGLTAQAVESNVTCNGRTLIITPTNPLLAALETGLLRARVENVKDVHGNPMSAPVSWQFNIARQDFAWSPSRLVVAAAFGQEAIARSSLTNGTGANIDFTLENAPAWLTLPAAGGTVGAGETLELTFIVSDTLSLGSRTDTLDAVLSSGPLSGQSVALEIRVDVSCVRPALSLNAADYEHSMTFVSRVQINGVTSADRRDVLAAYVGNQLRGVARPDSISPTQWLYFLTVYGNRLAGETVRFQVWDDDACRLYTATDKAMTFEADKQVGSLAAPYVLASRIPAPGAEQLIAANLGWTWISLNRKSPLGLSTNLVLGDLNPSAGDLIKTLGQFSTFDPAYGWQGTLDSLDNATGYMIHLSEAGTIVLNGTPAFPSLTPITVGTGWNWIGYVPQASLSTDAALTGLAARANGDLIKSQYGFAQYNAATQKWIGSLTTMDPGQGYKLYTTGAATTFIYPNPGPNPTLALSTQRKGKDAALAVAALKRDAGVKGAAAETGPAWDVNPRVYQYNMTITAELRLGAGAPSPEGFQVAAMINGEVRGIAQAEYVSGLGKYMVFLMVYSNVLEGETMTFQVYDPTQGAVRNAAETLAFQPDRIHGTLAAPMALNLGGGQHVVGGPFSLSNAYPNPFKIGASSRINFSLPVETHVELQIFDVAGRLRRTLVSGIQPAGLHEVTVEAGNLDAGFYYYRLKAGSHIKFAKMTILR